MKWNASPNLAIFDLRVMCGMKRVIVFALKDNYELIVCEDGVTTSFLRSLLFSLLSVQHTGRASQGRYASQSTAVTEELMPQIFDWDYLMRTLSEKFVPKIAQHGKQDNIITTLIKHLEFAAQHSL